uniref:NADH dehydrogenase subunit 6 n=1 Tax=Sambus femoralis TaxID=2946729 RepID=UPI00207ABD51|nr:NADH dehydrogenase subunit 6 [Sambus femoralis]URN73112.1 NADH dehydrogenase subunit 6 [Sambus femoralis]
MKIMLMMSMIITIMFIMTKHPISMGFNLLAQSMMIALLTGIFSMNFWYSYILFIIMVGGMLVLFIYMTCVASNKKFSLIKVKPMLGIMLTCMLISIKMDLLTIMTEEKNENWINSLIKFFTFPHSLILVSMMIYLLLTLIATVKITKIEMGPLRKMN